MSTPLYEIATELQEVIDAHTDPETGEISDEGVAAIEAVEMKLEDKALAIAAFCKSEKRMGDAIQEEERALKKRREAHHNRANRLKAYLQETLEPGVKFEGPRARIGWRKSTSVDAPDVDVLPIEFVIYSSRADKPLLKTALEQGKTIEGARLVTKQGVQIS